MNFIIELFTTFLNIGLFSIGGGYAIIPLIKEQVVDKYHWITSQVFTDIITISQMTPGPLAVNTSTFVGIQIAGIPGAIAATIGCVISGILIAIALYCFFKKRKESTYILEILNALKAASLGLIISAAMTILLLTFCGTSILSEIQTIDIAAVIIFLISITALRKWRMNPILLLLVTAVISIFLQLSCHMY